MATMIPDGVEEFGTEGEKRFYRFIEAAAKPDAEYLCWYLPNVSEDEPDFILYSQAVGLVIFEVKDWGLNQIEGADPRQFLIRTNGKTEPRKNPFRQARDYLYSLKGVIQKDGHLVSSEPAFRGKPKVPLGCGVVFPNISKHEYTEKGFQSVTGTRKIFFLDDLHSMSDICRDATGQCFHRALREKFRPLFRCDLTVEEVDHLRSILFPVVRIELPRRGGEVRWEESAERLKVLDNHQEAIARRIGGGHSLIMGPSGSGKTLVLVHKAALLKRCDPNIRRILFVCYNITLVGYIKRLLSAKKVPLGEDGVEVLHFFELCSKILGQEIAYEKEEPEYYDLVIQETLSKAPASSVRYDAIVVDEGQDFSDEMVNVVASLLNEKTSNLTIALDEGQNIYGRRQGWIGAWAGGQGKVHRLSCVYRCTREISELASRFRRDEGSRTEEQKGQLEAPPTDVYECHGPKPDVRAFQDFDEVVSFVAGKIEELVNGGECPCSEIAILYTMRSAGGAGGRPVPEILGKALGEKGILHNWVSEDYRSKRSYDVTTDTVTLSTIQSAKGFDYSRVFLIGLDLFDPAKGLPDQLKSLAYVAMTRARDELFIPYVRKNGLIDRLLACV